jgi:hypothetical protein
VEVDVAMKGQLAALGAWLDLQLLKLELTVKEDSIDIKAEAEGVWPLVPQDGRANLTDVFLEATMEGADFTIAVGTTVKVGVDDPNTGVRHVLSFVGKILITPEAIGFDLHFLAPGWAQPLGVPHLTLCPLGCEIQAEFNYTKRACPWTLALLVGSSGGRSTQRACSSPTSWRARWRSTFPSAAT